MHKNMYKKTIYAIREDSNDSDSDNKGSKQVWCICRSTDSSRFMIACDSCEEWYHGDCVNITPKMAESISKYFCTWCQKKNPALKIVYKPMPLISKPKEKYEKYDKKEKIERFDKAIKVEKIDRIVKPKIEEKLTAPPVKTFKINKSSNCGECMGCFRKVDCNVCQNCRNKTGLGCLRRMCERRQTPVVEKVVKPQEKLMLTKLPMDFIPAKVAPPKKVIVTKPPQSHHTSAPSSSSSICSEPTSRPIKRPVSPSTCSDSGSNISSSNKPKAYPLPPLKKPKFNEVKPPEKPQQIPQPVYHAPIMASADSEEEEDDDAEEAESSSSDKSEDSEDFPSDIGGRAARFVHARPIKKPKIKHSTKKIAKKRKIIGANHTNDANFVQRRCTRKFEPEPIKNYKSFDCYNIGCNKPSRMGSKYCSDECGISLAEQRLLKYLPERITNWNNSVSISEEKDKQSRMEIKEELQTIHYNLDILNASHQDLTEFIERWRSTYSATSVVDCGVNEDSVQCVSCDMMVSSMKALAHMENCYQKIEGQTMVFADYEDAPIGTKLFCDYYDNNIRGYCKRLAALCDHHKDPKVDPKTICAFPLSVNEKSDKVCMTAKIKCNRHINWERIQRAVIDMNRYRLLVRYSDLQMEDKRLKHSLSQRGGVMALLTHETIDHQPLKPMLPITAIDGTKRMKKFTKAVCI